MKQQDRQLIAKIREGVAKLNAVSDDELRQASLELKFAPSSISDSKSLAVRALPIIIEVIRRKTGKIAHDVQIRAAERMLAGQLCEMKTGEGKTMTALLAIYALSLKQEGVHLATANDYLAARDAEYAASMFEPLGLTVGVVTGEVPPDQRMAVYRKNITYGTAKEFGFDFLRDELAGRRGNQRTVPAQNNILLDEADSLLIDEASTPLIIGLPDILAEQERADLTQWADHHAHEFEEDQDFEFEERNKFSFLTPGIMRLRQLPGTRSTQNVSLRGLSEYIESAIKAHLKFQRDVHYRVDEEKIAILDEFTGRIAEGRQWQRGLHQAIEAKERLKVSPRTETAASVTIQTLVNRYRFVTGMTGTAWDSRREFKKVYQLPVISIPTNKPVDREQAATEIYATMQQKFLAVVDRASELSRAGRSVLIGTRTLDQSEILSQQFAAKKLSHYVLNASRQEREADIVADAGQPGRITVATNMAGRGTDIPLHDDVRKLGGLHVMLTELHESRRIDWQLIGRSARQGDPGSYQIFLSLEDEILVNGLSERVYRRLMQKWNLDESSLSEAATLVDSRLPSNLLRYFEKAQLKIEATHLKNRMILLTHEKERRERFGETGENPFVYPSR